MTKSKLTIASLIIASMLAPTVASARCSQIDLAGKWESYSAGVQGGVAYWARCQFTVSSAGAMSRASCVDSSRNRGPITQGTVKLAFPSVCTFTASFRLGGALNKVVHGTLAKDKITGSGVGTFPGGAFIFSLNKL